MSTPSPAAEQPRSWIQPYYTSFNGLRGFAILAVFLRHYAILVLPFHWIYGLWFGVDLFFVLSGFLITGILFDTLGEPHFFRNFYLRRALRIFPLFYGFFLVLLLGSLLSRTAHFNRFFWTYALYLGNLFFPSLDLAGINPTIFYFHIFGRQESLAIGTFWSLCVEEQFYLVWPLVIFTVRSRTRLMHLAAVLAGAVLLLRILLVHLLPVSLQLTGLLYSSTYTRVDTLLIGAWCALWLRGAQLSPARLRLLCYSVGLPSLIVLLLGAGLTLPRWPAKEDNPFLATIGLTLIALVSAAALLLSLDETTWIHRLTRLRPLASLGVVSYGFYLLHELPGNALTNFLRWHTLSRWTLALIVSGLFLVILLAAEISFRFYETPFLKLKRVLAPSRHSGPSVERSLADPEVTTL